MRNEVCKRSLTQTTGLNCQNLSKLSEAELRACPRARTNMWTCLTPALRTLTQADVVSEHVEDALTAVPFVPTAVARAPLGHLGAAVAHIVGSHDSS